MTTIILILLIYMEYTFIKNLIASQGVFGTVGWIQLVMAILFVPAIVYMGIRAYRESKKNKAAREEEMKKQEEELRKKRRAKYAADFAPDADPESPDYREVAETDADEEADLDEISNSDDWENESDYPKKPSKYDE